METEPVDGIEDHQSGETPEDVAILYSWANLQGAKYRDFSANRREYRAQMRHRAAEQLRLVELKAQAEAEAAAAEAEAEAASAHAEADAATVRLAASRVTPPYAAGPIKAAEEVELQRRSSLREASQQARRAVTERLEAARRAEAAALAESIARREEREIAEAQASALRQAAQYADSEFRNRQAGAAHFDNAIPGRISDPYSPQMLAEGEYFENPGTAMTELAASRFRNQRESIEIATGAQLPSFRMPGEVNEKRGHERAPDAAQDHGGRVSPGWADKERPTHREGDFTPRNRTEVIRDDRDISALGDDLERRTREQFPARPGQEPPVAALEISGSVASAPYSRPRRNGEDIPPRRPEVVHRIPEDESGFLYRADPADYGRDHSDRGASEGGGSPSHEDTYGWPEEQGRNRQRDRRASSFSGYPGTNMGYASPSGSEPLFRPDMPHARPVQDATERKGESPRASFAQDFWSDAPGQPDTRPARTPLPEPSEDSKRGARDVDTDSGPEWLGRKPAGREAQQGNQHPLANAAKDRLSGADTLQSSREQIASRWFALKEIFAQRDTRHPPAPNVVKETNRKAPVIAVFSVAGGTGKTSLVATLGRTLSSLGEKVLLAESTFHGLLPFYFGASEVVPGVVRTFLPPSGSSDAPVRLVSYKIGAEPDANVRDHLADDLIANSHAAHRVLVDLDVNGSWLIERLTEQQLTVLVPLAADMNSIISLQAVEGSFSNLRDAEGEPLRPMYVLNQFDASLPLHLDVREILRQQLGDRLLPLVIRHARGVSEALAEGMTIPDYDSESVAAQDYLGLANWVRARSVGARAGAHDLRWSER